MSVFSRLHGYGIHNSKNIGGFSEKSNITVHSNNVYVSHGRRVIGLHPMNNYPSTGFVTSSTYYFRITPGMFKGPIEDLSLQYELTSGTAGARYIHPCHWIESIRVRQVGGNNNIWERTGWQLWLDLVLHGDQSRLISNSRFLGMENYWPDTTLIASEARIFNIPLHDLLSGIDLSFLKKNLEMRIITKAGIYAYSTGSPVPSITSVNLRAVYHDNTGVSKEVAQQDRIFGNNMFFKRVIQPTSYIRSSQTFTASATSTIDMKDLAGYGVFGVLYSLTASSPTADTWDKTACLAGSTFSLETPQGTNISNGGQPLTADDTQFDLSNNFDTRVTKHHNLYYIGLGNGATASQGQIRGGYYFDGGAMSLKIAVGTSATNEVQTLTPSGTIDGGHYTFTYKGKTSETIVYSATAAVMREALQKIVNDGHTVTVSGPATSAFTITFQDGAEKPGVVGFATHSNDGGVAVPISNNITTPYVRGISRSGTAVQFYVQMYYVYNVMFYDGMIVRTNYIPSHRLGKNKVADLPAAIAGMNSASS